jgi:glutathione S-transferase
MCRVGFYPAAHDTRSVFADSDTMRRINPLGRIPSLVLDHNSATILDWLDQSVGPERALVPATGPERRRALRRIALATGAIEKAGAAVYEQPSTYRGRTGSSAAAPRRQARYRGPRRRALADGRTARPGADHRRLHDPLHADGPYRPHSARALSDARHAVRELRGATRIPGDLPRRICRAAKRVSGRSVSTLGTLSRRSTEQPTLGMPHPCAVFADS